MLNRHLTRRALAASPLALAPIVAVAGLDGLESAAGSLAGWLEALARAVLTVGAVAPLLVAVAVVLGLQARRGWLSLRLMGYGQRGLLARVALICAPIAVVIAMVAFALPEPPMGDVVVGGAVRVGEAGWLVPMDAERALYIEPDRALVERRAAPPRRDTDWTRALTLTQLPRALALLLWLPLFGRFERSDGSVSTTGALGLFLATAILTALGQTLVGLLVQSGALDASVGAWGMVAGMVAVAVGAWALASGQRWGLQGTRTEPRGMTSTPG